MAAKKRRHASDTGGSDKAGTSGPSSPHLLDHERRRHPRVLVDLEVDYGDRDNFLFASILDISATGIFVRTTSPEAAGTHLNLRFTPTGANAVLEIEGEVIWVNAYRPDARDNLNPGMGIRFIGLTDEQRHRLVEFVHTFAFVDDKDVTSA
jgi:type IV pilus assembly protein PilZ